MTNIAAALAVAAVGPGRYSLDALLGISLPEPVTFTVFGAIALVITVAGLVLRRLAKPATEATPQTA